MVESVVLRELVFSCLLVCHSWWGSVGFGVRDETDGFMMLMNNYLGVGSGCRHQHGNAQVGSVGIMYIT